MDPNTIDQYVLELVGMDHVDAEGMPDNSVRGKTWLHNILYGASKMIDKDMFDFEPHTRGAYSQAVADSVEMCARNGLLCIHQTGRDGGAVHLMEEGEKARDTSACDREMLEQIRAAKSFLNNLNYREMIVYSYTKFPEMAKHSEILDDFESWRVDAAVSIYLKGAVSFALAARMSGMNREEFEIYIYEGGVEPYSSLVTSVGRDHGESTNAC